MDKRLIVLAICVLLWNVAQAQQKPCTEAEYRQAEKEADTLRSWDALYRSYRLYGRCEDVDASEGYAESIARILVDHWETLPRLSQLIKKDTGFGNFVGLSATMNMKDVARIKDNATRRCPAGLTALCNELRQQADDAIEEDASVRKKQ